MPNPNRTIASASINNAFSNQTDQTVQMQEAAYAWKTLMLAAGWTVVRSSDGDAGAGVPGGGNADASDNWTSAAVLGIDTTALGGAWIVLASPSGWLPGGGTLYLKAFINDADTTNPQQFQIQASNATYTGGTTTALPTTTGNETTVIAVGDDIIPWSAVETGYWAGAASARGDVWFGVKKSGDSFFRHIWIITANVDADGSGTGNFRYNMFAASGATDVVIASQFKSSSYNRGHSADGSDATVTNVIGSVIWDVSWTNGLDYLNQLEFDQITLLCTDATEGRILGQGVDITPCPPALAFGQLVDSETSQTYRRVCCGDVMLFVPKASLPFS